MEKLLNSAEAARFLEISQTRLRQLCNLKLVPTYMIAGKLLRFKQGELRALKDKVKDGMDIKDERIFHQEFSRVTGLEKIKEIVQANDVYFFTVLIIFIILGIMVFK